MTKLSSLSFLIPAYNDEATIGQVIREAVAVGKRVARKFEIVVVNDGSRDMTGWHLVTFARVSDGTRLRVITHRTNQGYGKTIKELYYAGKYEWLFTIPGDYQVGARELVKLINSYNGTISSPRRRGSSLKKMDSPDMILGWRVKRNDPVKRLLFSWIYNTLLRVLFGIKLHDVNSVRLMRRSLLQDITLTSTSAFVDAELVIGVKRIGYTVTEVPISHRARTDGAPGGGNQWGTMVATVGEMVRFFL